MKFALRTEIIIDANAEDVWAVFADFKEYPNWNPFVKSITGEVKVGNKITAILDTMTFKPIVLKFKDKEEFRWKGKLLMKGLFDGEHYFRLEAQPDGKTKFVHGERFNGILVRMLKKKLQTEIKDGFVKMNEALKARVEERR